MWGQPCISCHLAFLASVTLTIALANGTSSSSEHQLDPTCSFSGPCRSSSIASHLMDGHTESRGGVTAEVGMLLQLPRSLLGSGALPPFVSKHLFLRDVPSWLLQSFINLNLSPVCPALWTWAVPHICGPRGYLLIPFYPFVISTLYLVSNPVH